MSRADRTRQGSPLELFYHLSALSVTLPCVSY